MANRTIPRTCEHCGATFFAAAYDIRIGQGRFCGRSCATKFRITDTLQERFWQKVAKTDDCWLFVAARDGDGYGVISANGRLTRAHRLSYQLAHGDIPEGQMVLHRCDNPPCVRAECDVPGCEHLRVSANCESHLFLGTNQDNVNDMVSKGRQNIHPPHQNGEQHHNAKLKAGQVREIKQALARGESCRILGKKYNVTEGAIHGIKSGRNWKGI